MPFRDPLPETELRAIRERQPWNSDVITLLWEVKRLRWMMLKAHQMWSEVPRPVGILASVYDEFTDALKNEACVKERDQVVSELLDTPPKPRKGMTPR
ncbi:hypothetical protein [Bordetella pseudohinzii]|uniref:Uncharacterized protein n=1 Tax=Bordetella pseudohinzii TaxID=1331258 RepID=A0A0J6C4B1_9BORD|nr:hypothetical protein [Bordetella pseudohinzii]ANY18485.1 hypothetical protein BBN53_20900 [Bordetella pseudohinzii]KMM24112.1 hypothetical protein L540_08275 [Bordetella pseudohinzii]KXA77884.1 hypothetical protein AW878_14410 [Bordetella pseudohinzii]KXA78079.1 hypothetical protein AW877_12865 [Bordetella pseudohinzii]CUJ13113.1 Uncharacterised protein [Bordetella pseudohinzii]